MKKQIKYVIFSIGLIIILIYNLIINPVVEFYDGKDIYGNVIGGKYIDYGSSLTICLFFILIWFVICIIVMYLIPLIYSRLRK